MLDDLKKHKRYIGLKQSISAIEQGIVSKAFVARDVAPHISENIISKCESTGVPIEYVETMAELGKACSIDVGAAIAVLLKADVC